MNNKVIAILDILLTGIMMFAVGCAMRETPIYSHFEDLNDDNWNTLTPLVFSFEDGVDSARLAAARDAEMRIVMRCSSRYGNHRFPIAITYVGYDGESQTDTIQFQLSETLFDEKKDGYVVRTRSRHGVKEAQIGLPRRFNADELYEVHLRALTPKQIQRGLSSVGIVIYD